MDTKYKVSISESKNYVILDFEGIVSPEEMALMTYEVDRVALDHGILAYWWT